MTEIMKKDIIYTRVGFVSLVILLCPLRIWAQDNELRNYDRDTLIAAAIEIMETSRYCALITLDKAGQSQVRTMDPFLPGEDMVGHK